MPTSRCARADRRRAWRPVPSVKPPRNKRQKAASPGGFVASPSRKFSGRRPFSGVMGDPEDGDEQQGKQQPRQRHAHIRKFSQISQRGDGAEIKGTRSHLGQLKIRPGEQESFAHGADEFLRPWTGTQKLLLPFAG